MQKITSELYSAENKYRGLGGGEELTLLADRKT
jgi:hypothetical protein